MIDTCRRHIFDDGRCAANGGSGIEPRAAVYDGGTMVHHEMHAQKSGPKLNWLRAAVLGSNDGIVSVASIIVGVAGASDSTAFVLTRQRGGARRGSIIHGGR